VTGTTEEENEFDSEAKPGYSEQTLEYLLELPEHVNDRAWHEKNKRRYEQVLRDPSQAIVDELRTRYIQRLSPTVAGGKRHLSILKKNDYGKGGYHDHYWYAFYDPAAGSKTKSVQLYVRFLAGEGVWRYGLAMGEYCGNYLERLSDAFTNSREAVADYLRHAPDKTIIRLVIGDKTIEYSPTEFAAWLMGLTDDVLRTDTPIADIDIIREYPLSTLPDLAETLVDEVGRYFTWAWPLFDAAVTGHWPVTTSSSTVSPPGVELAVDVDENAPQTLRELAELTALSEAFLEELEEALWAKQQAILVGPPGTSKTYIARQFARYFVRQLEGRPQGSFDVLYMHANWAYEDFFEGLKPTSKDGLLTFETRKGFFLEWVERLRSDSAKAVHVLVLDEINRCDTAAVLGELLQLLEYRGTTVRLMSGRNFVFPSNLYIIGTMNSADRSIGRLDLALRRRFLWLDMYPQPETLDRWLKRPGNNPLGFDPTSLAQKLVAPGEHGIPPEQQIGHALFILQRIGEDDDVSPKLDVPLNERKLRQIVRFSVLPYVRELGCDPRKLKDVE
jgi:MoxR-like ATPase